MLPSDTASHELRQVCLNVLEQHLAGDSADRTVLLAAAERCLMDLGGSLAVVFGIEGHRALLERALRLTADEFPTLAAAHPRTRPPGRVTGLQRSVRRLPPEQAKKALALTLANVAWLLTKLIGSDLCLHLLRQAWPDISVADLEQPRADVAETTWALPSASTRSPKQKARTARRQRAC